MKLNFGCGNSKMKGYIGIDRYDFGQGQGYILDLEKDKLPFKDNSVSDILCHHFLEHLWDVKHILNESWRVLEKDGVMGITVPYGLWEGASNPTHHQIITESWFNFLTRDKTKYYGYEQWKILELGKKSNGIEIYCRMSPLK